MHCSKLIGRAVAAAFAASVGLAGIAGAAPDAGEYKLGIVSDDTGPLAAAGISFHNGADLAIEEINAKALAGEGVSFTLEVKDSASDAARAVQAMTQFAADRKVMAVTCCILSSIAGAVGQIATSSQLPLVIYGATREGLPQEPYVTSVVALPGPQEVMLAERMAAEVDPKSVAFFKQSDNDIFLARAKSIEEVMKASGAEISAEVFVLGADTDFTGPATQAMATNPDMIYVWTTQQAAVGIITALRQRGYEGVIVTSEVISPPAVFQKSGKTVADIPFALSFQPGVSDTEVAKGFIQAYSDKFGALPDVYAAQGYTAVQFIAQAMKSLDGAPSRADLAKAMWGASAIDINLYGGQDMANGQAHTPATLIVNWTPEGEVKLWEKE